MKHSDVLTILCNPGTLKFRHRLSGGIEFSYTSEFSNCTMTTRFTLFDAQVKLLLEWLLDRQGDNKDA